MYNRYSMEIRDDDFVPLREEDRRRPAPPPPGPGPLPPGPHHPTPPPGPPPHHPAPPPHGDAGGRDLLGQLLGGLHLRQLETDDLLLLGIAWLLLRENGDEDLFLILAALFFLGGE